MEQDYYKCRLTLIEMMKDRKYTHEKGLDVFKITLDEFRLLFKNSEDQNSGLYPTTLDMSGIKTVDGKHVYVRVINGFFKDAKSFYIFDKSKSERSEFIPIAEHFKMSMSKDGDLDALFKNVHIIIIYRAPKKKDNKYDFTLETSFLDNPDVEAIPVHKLTFNVTKHELVNPHRMLTEDEKKKVYEKFNASKQMFTKMCVDDPVNVYYNGRPGDMYQVSRNGYKPAYRVVVGRPLPRKK